MTIDLKGKKIFVTTNPEYGWDCVTGIYLSDSEESLIEFLGEDYDEDTTVIHSRGLKIVQSKAEIRDEKINTIID